MPPTRLALATILMLPMVGIGAASAQQAPTGSVGSTGFSPPVHGPDTAAPRRPKEPPGLPGTAAKPGESAAGVQTDLAPTEALFDAINRGDVTEARDAVSRGADVNGQNALGMTPIDLSIDLSRNDITFLLLSVRSQDSGGGAPAGSVKAAAADKGTPAPKLAAARAIRLRAAQATIVARRPVAAPAAPARYAGNGGTPNPQAGFLGFGTSGQP